MKAQRSEAIDSGPVEKGLQDAAAIEQVIAGNRDAFEGMMRRHNQRLFRLARSIVTDDSEAIDVVQEAYLCAYQRLGELKNRRAFGRWVAQITRNTALMRLRKSRRYESVQLTV